MKKLLIISWSVFVLGLVFGLLHFPGNALLKVIGCSMLFTHSFIFLFKNAKTNLPIVFVLFTFAFWTTYLLFRLQYWKYAQFLFLVSLVITLICLIVHVYKKTPFKFSQLILIIYIIISFVISFTPAHKIFYFFNLTETMHNDRRNESYFAWDKYSWFLYISGETQKAMEANNNAQNVINEYLKTNNDNEAKEFSLILQKHAQEINNNNWTDFDD